VLYVRLADGRGRTKCEDRVRRPGGVAFVHWRSSDPGARFLGTSAREWSNGLDARRSRIDFRGAPHPPSTAPRAFREDTRGRAHRGGLRLAGPVGAVGLKGRSQKRPRRHAPGQSRELGQQMALTRRPLWPPILNNSGSDFRHFDLPRGRRPAMVQPKLGRISLFSVRRQLVGHRPHDCRLGSPDGPPRVGW
jgi:hypothetical protein